MTEMRLLLLTTGGTIAESATPAGDALRAAVAPTADQLRDVWGINLEVESMVIADVDSSNIKPEHWTQLSSAIAERYDEYDAFVITHGTNTMGYTCAALSYALGNVWKPVVVTGSQIPFGRPGSDAVINLHNAITVAAYPYHEGIRGVVCVFGSHIITGTRVKKSSEFDLDAFAPLTSSGIGRIGRTLEINLDSLRRHHSYLTQSGRPPALMRRDLLLRPKFSSEIISLTEFPGMGADVFRTMLASLIERDGQLIRGVVFRAFGAGDVASSLHPVFEYLHEREIPALITTQAPLGVSNFGVNEPGRTLGALNVATPAHDMSIEAGTTKLAWLLAQNVRYARIASTLTEDLHGEISVTADSSG